MAELPLSKFAPFNKEECKFQYEVSNKLDEIGVKCSNCIYFGKELPKEVDEYALRHPMEDKTMYSCSILTDYDNGVCDTSLCRFFTNQEEIEDVKEDNSELEDSNDSSDEELSIQIQKLDFTNSDISKTINKLRERLINEQSE